ncbi:MAG: energy transducer TonB [bacterium]
MQERKSNDVRVRYQHRLELCLVVSLLICIFTFGLFRNWYLHAEPQDFTMDDIIFDNVDITRQPNTPPPPPPKLPSVPVPVPNEVGPVTVPIPYEYIDSSKIRKPPVPKEQLLADTIFVAVDQRPVPIGGFKAIMDNLKYPEFARRVGLSGKVEIKFVVTKRGNVTRTKIVTSSGHAALDEAAISALKSVKWYPARQREKPVNVWMKLPFIFDLR